MYADANHDDDVDDVMMVIIRKKRKRRKKRMVMKMLPTRQVPRQRFEVVVVMEGTSETSNMTFQVVLLIQLGFAFFGLFSSHRSSFEDPSKDDPNPGKNLLPPARDPMGPEI